MIPNEKIKKTHKVNYVSKYMTVLINIVNI